MATFIHAGSLGELVGVGASKGVSLTSTAARTVLPLGARHLSMTPRNFSTAVVARFNTNPWLTIGKTTDLLVTKAAFTDYSVAAQDSDDGTDVVLSSIDTIANGHALYVGSHAQFSGVEIDVDAVNGTSSVLTVKYRKSDDTWADISDTDGTASGGASMAQDGNVTWTIPGDWISTALKDSGDASTVVAKNFGWVNRDLFWTRWEWSVALDSSTTQNSWISINRSTAYAELVSGQNFEQAVTVGPGGISSVTLLTDDGTANMLVVASASRRHV